MKAGFTMADITPAVGREKPGNFGKSYIKSIHDAIKVRASVFEGDNGEGGTATIAIVGVDTCEMVSPSIYDRIRAGVEKATGIPPAQLCIASSHTHNGGPAAFWLPQEFADAPPFLRDLMANDGIHADPLYCDHLIAQTISAVTEAHRKREPVKISVGSGKEENAAFNRRFRMRDGKVYTHPGKVNPDIVEPEGPSDPEVGVIAAWGENGDLRGCLVNFSCHCTTFGGDVASADWVAYMENVIQSVMGREAVVVFLPGAMGDQTQVDNQNPRRSEHGEIWSLRVGTAVGAEALKVLVRAEKGDGGTLTIRSEMLPLKRRVPSPARVAACREIVEEGIASDKKDTIWHFAKEILILDWLCQNTPIVEAEIMAIQIGPAVLLTNPSEYFASSGRAIKAASAHPFTYVVTLANGDIGYVPPLAAFDPKSGGGYETVMNSYTNAEPDAERKIREASIRLAAQLTPGTVPPPPSVTEPGKPWNYGNLAPEVK